MPWVLGYCLQVGHQEYGHQGGPQLDLHGVSRRADETLDMEQLFEVSEEHLDFPPCLVKVGYRAGRELHVVGEQFDRESVFLVVNRNPSQALRVFLHSLCSVKFDDLVYEDILMSLFWQRKLFDSMIYEVPLVSDDEAHIHAVPIAQQAEVAVAPVCHNQAERLDFDMSGRSPIASLSVSNVYILRK